MISSNHKIILPFWHYLNEITKGEDAADKLSKKVTYFGVRKISKKTYQKN